jgi:hypothetical protein
MEVSDLPLFCDNMSSLCMLDMFEKDNKKLAAMINVPKVLTDKFPNESYKLKCMVLSTKFSEASTGKNELDLSSANINLACFDKLEDAVELYSLAERMTLAKFHIERLRKAGARMRIDIPIKKQHGDNMIDDQALEIDLNLFKILFSKNGLYDKS